MPLPAEGNVILHLHYNKPASNKNIIVNMNDPEVNFNTIYMTREDALVSIDVTNLKQDINITYSYE